MDNVVQENKLSDLRNDKFNSEDEVVLQKSFFGGYSKKAVLQYIQDLKTRLSTAERSFNERIEEYAAMSTMLTKERDKYVDMLQKGESEAAKYRQQIIELEKEKSELNQKITELSENALNENDVKIFEEKLQQNEEMKVRISQMDNQIKEFEGYKDYNDELKAYIENLELKISELNEQMDNYSKNEFKKEEYEILISENELIKQQYDDAMYEKSVILAEKNVLAEKYARIYDSLTDANKKNRELREINTKIKLKTRKMMADFESKLYECSQNHKSNIEQITENIKNVLEVITYENMDITKLLNISDGKIDFEDNEFEQVDTEIDE